MAIAQPGRWVIADPEGGPPVNHKNIGFLSNTGLDPLKNHKATKAAFNVGPTMARQRIAGGPMIGAYSGIWILRPLIN